MGYIKDPDGVTLYVEHRRPTPEEDREVSEYIARSRAKRLAAESASPEKKIALSVGTKKRSRTAVVA